MVSGDTQFTGILSTLIEKPVYFLGGHNNVIGILIRAGLNTAPAYIYLFDRITYFEEHLRKLILDNAPNWKQTPVTTDELDDIKNRYEDAQTANIALEKIHYAQFSTKGEADSLIHEINEFRNDVAHANLLVENTDSNKLLSSGRTTEKLHNPLETIHDVLSNLQEHGMTQELPHR